jgi:sialic acid synthase SpsE
LDIKRRVKRMSEIKLPSGRKIGDGHPVFIIAEVGSNWSNLEDCMTSISQAKMCGADAVKFQLYNDTALYGMTTDLIGNMPLSFLPKLKEKADAVGIEFMCSAFSPELLDEVNKYVNVHKVASSEMCHVRMLERLRGYGKPVFLSTGAQHLEDIKIALRHLNCNESDKQLLSILGIGSTDERPVVVMYCPASYPSRHFNHMTFYALKEFSPLIGFSDHTIDVYNAPCVAKAEGSCVIEKHVNFVGATGPDAPHSLSGEDFMAMCTAIKKGPPEWHGPIYAEQAFITRHKRRLIATTDVKPGQMLTEGGNFGIYRSLKDDSHAFSPWMVDEVDGCIAKRDIKAGDGIGPGDV